MNRDNKLVKFTTFVLLITIVAICLVSGTYAKYTSTASGTAKATVAKWSLEVNDTQIATKTPAEVTFNLFETINDTKDGAAEADVANKKIAPGTQGSFNLVVENLSEVTATYTIDFTIVNNSTIPVEFSTDGGSTWTSTLSQVKAKADLAAESGKETVTVQWRWVYQVVDESDVVNEAVDTADTELGIAAQTTAPEISVTAKITATQVD